MMGNIGMILVLHVVSLICIPHIAGEAPVPVYYTIEEEVTVGTRVGQLSVDAKLNEKYPPQVLSQLRFSYLSHPVLAFTLELTTGSIITGEDIDREEICPLQDICELKFDVAVQPVDFFQIIKVTITVRDINDNWPMFPEPTVTREILESASLGTTLSLPSAVDSDSPIYGIQSYEVLDGTGRFGLKINDKLDGSIDVKLFLEKKLDREMKDEYSVRVVATDGGGLTGTLDILITVLDANDHHPLFDNATYEVIIHENLPLDTMILPVKAHDPDIGDNGEIRYGFSARTRSKYGHLFPFFGTICTADKDIIDTTPCQCETNVNLL